MSYLLSYYRQYQHLEIQGKFKTLDGITENENGYVLSAWLWNQRLLYKNNKLTPEQIEKLNAIGMRWDIIRAKISWDDWYKLAKSFYNKNQHLEIPGKFKTLDGITEDENGYAPGIWLETQRQSYKNNKLTPEQIEKLNAIGMRWDNINITWDDWYKLAETFYNKNQHLEIPERFKTLDGITEDENGHTLGRWLARQRQLYRNNKLTPEQIEKLNAIGMFWSVNKSKTK